MDSWKEKEFSHRRYVYQRPSFHGGLIKLQFT